VTNLGAFNLLASPNLVIKIDRAKAARYAFPLGTSIRWCSGIGARR